MPVGQQGSEQGAESQSRVRRSTGEREPEQQASQLETFPATTVPQAPSDLERNYMVEALQGGELHVHSNLFDRHIRVG